MAESRAADYLHELAMDVAFNERPDVTVWLLPLADLECEHGSLPGDLLAACSCFTRPAEVAP